MPRISRTNSKTITNTYHIMIRGINKQDIFFDDFDKEKFIKEIKLAKEKYKYKIYAYVIMNNHVHLVIHDAKDCISEIMHMICSKYAMYFNKKYERVGHVFQNRFKSLCVDTEEYLLNLVRYIHKNPEIEKIGPKEEYKWSSYKDYLYIKNNKHKISDTEFVLCIIDNNRKKAVESFIYFSNQQEIKYSDTEFEFERYLSDERAVEFIKNSLGIDNILEIQNYNKKIRDEYIFKIAKIKGIYAKQISRLLGIGERNIQKIIKEKSKTCP